MNSLFRLITHSSAYKHTQVHSRDVQYMDTVLAACKWMWAKEVGVQTQACGSDHSMQGTLMVNVNEIIKAMGILHQ